MQSIMHSPMLPIDWQMKMAMSVMQLYRQYVPLPKVTHMLFSLMMCWWLLLANSQTMSKVFGYLLCTPFQPLPNCTKSTIMTVVPVVFSPLTSDSKTQVAVLETLSTLAKTEIFAAMVNDVLDPIIALCSDESVPTYVHAYALKTLAALTPNSTFHNKLKDAIPIIVHLLLENKGEVQAIAITTLISFATTGLLV
ncbi:hypothetical protein FB45DRAFT_171865 [Roridomyces roridus]|uniref:Uncharacterized protein n=1 Tax=Roridomyces roridus TaxID=1738132 RepID=A0AAD7BEY7_9AGAR|nr:hypothetical protein FB45DRAFT_171865 [Roridomyces roridus]